MGSVIFNIKYVWNTLHVLLPISLGQIYSHKSASQYTNNPETHQVLISTRLNYHLKFIIFSILSFITTDKLNLNVTWKSASDFSTCVLFSPGLLTPFHFLFPKNFDLFYCLIIEVKMFKPPICVLCTDMHAIPFIIQLGICIQACSTPSQHKTVSTQQYDSKTLAQSHVSAQCLQSGANRISNHSDIGLLCL